MAEQYPIGVTQLRYRATSFKEALEVKADIIQPDLAWQYNLLFTEIGGGLYTRDIDFNMPGIWTFLFYEDGVKKTSQNFLISRISQNITYITNMTNPRIIGGNKSKDDDTG